MSINLVITLSYKNIFLISQNLLCKAKKFIYYKKIFIYIFLILSYYNKKNEFPKIFHIAYLIDYYLC